MQLRHILFILFVLSFLYPVHSSHFCVVVDSSSSCPSGSNEVFYSYGYTNTHLSSTLVTPGYRHCCSFIDQVQLIPATQTCSSIDYEAGLIDLYQASDSHVAQNGTLTSSSNYRLCANNSQNKIECRTALDDRTVNLPYIPVLHFFQQLNSHAELSNLSSIGQTGNPQYDNTVSCRIIPIAPTLTDVFAIDHSTLRARIIENSINEDYFEFYGSTSPGATAPIGQVDSATTTSLGNPYIFDWSGRTPNTTYYIRARTIDEDGSISEYSNELSRSTNASVPSAVKATYVDDATINISWSHNSNPIDTIYTVYSGTRNDPAFITSYACKASGRTWCLHPNRRDDTQYCYAVSAMNSESVYSANSTSVCATTSFTSNFDLVVKFDPSRLHVPKDGFVKTYLFIKNKGNVPDRYNLNFDYDANAIEITPETTFIEIPANSWDRIELTVSAKNINGAVNLVANVVSAGDAGKNGQATFTLDLVNIIGLPGLETWGLVLLGILGSLSLLA